jgi:hypothetical protein
MRRVLGALAAAAVMVGIALPAEATLPGAGGGAEQTAVATWVRMHGDTGVFYAADGLRMVDEGVPVTLGGVDKGRCNRTKSKGWVVTICMASGVMREIGLDQFQFDPALRSASLLVDARGQTHTADWTSKENPDVAHEGATGQWGAYAAAGAFANAPAVGKVFGRDLSTRCGFCFLFEGGGASVFSDANRELKVTREGRDFRVRLTTKVRR